jgi:hypothetical protein
MNPNPINEKGLWVVFFIKKKAMYPQRSVKEVNKNYQKALNKNFEVRSQHR